MMIQLELCFAPPCAFAWNDVKYSKGAEDPLFNLGDGLWLSRSAINDIIGRSHA